jgi:hypothetical protein
MAPTCILERASRLRNIAAGLGLRRRGGALGHIESIGRLDRAALSDHGLEAGVISPA